MCKQVIHRTTVATSSTHLSSNDACHCKALWFSVGNELIIHYTSTITCTRQQQQHTKDAKYTCTLPSTKRHCMLSWKEKMPFEKQIHKLLYIISQRQTKIKHIKKATHRRNLWAAGQVCGKSATSSVLNQIWISPVWAFSSLLQSSCLISCVRRRLWAPRCTCIPSTFRRSLVASSY